jgi:hypothetical protein
VGFGITRCRTRTLVICNTDFLILPFQLLPILSMERPRKRPRTVGYFPDVGDSGRLRELYAAFRAYFDLGKPRLHMSDSISRDYSDAREVILAGSPP